MSDAAMVKRVRRAIEKIEERLVELRNIVVEARQLDVTSESWLDDNRVIQQQLDDWQLSTASLLYKEVHPQVGVKLSTTRPKSNRLDSNLIGEQANSYREFLLELTKTLRAEPERVLEAPLEEKTMLEQIEEREQRSFDFLRLLYEKTVGENDRYKSVKIAELSAEMGLFPRVTSQERQMMSSQEKDALFEEGKTVEQMVISLLEEGKVKGVGQPNPYYDSEVRITAHGIRVVTETLKAKSKSEVLLVSEARAPVENSVFIVHGHDKDTLKSVENLLYRIGAKPYTFASIPKKGSPTVIEILEQAVPVTDAVLVLMTPDDEGRKRGSIDKYELRARQNVIAEAGFALISRRNSSLIVAVGNVSIPTDFEGIHRVQCEEFDKDSEHRIAKRLKDIGLTVDTSSV